MGKQRYLTQALMQTATLLHLLRTAFQHMPLPIQTKNQTLKMMAKVTAQIRTTKPMIVNQTETSQIQMTVITDLLMDLMLTIQVVTMQRIML